MPDATPAVDELLEDSFYESPGELELRDGADTAYSTTVKLLTHGTITLTEDNLIDTDTFANGIYPLFGFGEESANMASLDALGYTLGTSQTGSLGTLITTSSAPTLENSVGLGYLRVVTYTDFMGASEHSTGFGTAGSHESGYMFFNYANNTGGEPSYNLTRDAVEPGTGLLEYGQRTYEIGDPINYGDNESAGLRLKFGVDPTIAAYADSDGNIASQCIESSVSAMAELLVTSYAETEKAFPRTPPMTIQAKEIGNITTNEVAEGTTTAPQGTSVVTTGDGDGYS